MLYMHVTIMDEKTVIAFGMLILFFVITTFNNFSNNAKRWLAIAVKIKFIIPMLL